MAKTPTRFPEGVTNAAPLSALEQFGLPDPSQWHVWFNDFDQYNASDWTITQVGTGTETLLDEDGGVLQIVPGAVNQNSTYLQWSGDGSSTTETWLSEVGKRLYFKARFKVLTTANLIWYFGLVNTDTDPVTFTSGIVFRSIPQVDEGAVFLIVGDTAAGTVSRPTGRLTDDTYIDLAFAYDGGQFIKAYVNDKVMDAVTIEHLPIDTELSLSFGVRNDSATAKSLSIDYILVAEERFPNAETLTR